VIEELGPEARALLDAARQGLSPDARAVHRVRAKVGISAGGATVGSAIAGKLGIVALVAAVAAGAGVYATRGSTSAVAPTIELASPPEAPGQAAMREPAAPAIADDDLITIEAPRVATPPRTEPAIEVTRETPEAPAPSRGAPAAAAELPAQGVAGRGDHDGRAGGAGGHPRGITLAREVELLDGAMTALRRGDARGALHAVQLHAAETAGKGQLAEDAAAIEIEALCHLHDPTTNAKLEAFDARFPRSAQRSRLDNKCP
jgi:hypothetical protein